MRRREGSMRLAAAIAVLAALAAAHPPPANAGVDSWTPFGPGGARLVALAASTRGDLYAVAAFGDVAEIWQLPSGAAVWRWRSAGLGRPQVGVLAVHPTLPDQLWAVSGSPIESVYRSDDAGASWRLVSTAGAGFHALALWVVPSGGSVVLIADTASGVGRKLARSSDGGVTWSPMPGAAGPVAAAADEPGVVYAAAEGGGGVLRSHDAGRTFRATRGLGVPAGDELRALHATRGRRPLLFAAFRTGGLWRSTDGKGWERVGFAGFGPTGVVSSASDPRVIHVTAPPASTPANVAAGRGASG